MAPPHQTQHEDLLVPEWVINNINIRIASDVQADRAAAAAAASATHTSNNTIIAAPPSNQRLMHSRALIPQTPASSSIAAVPATNAAIQPPSSSDRTLVSARGSSHALVPTAVPYIPSRTNHLAPTQPDGPNNNGISYSNSSTTMHRQNEITLPRSAGPHKVNKPCPFGDVNCHFHHSTDACHKEWEKCSFALKAAKASYYAHSPWKGAPLGWNAQHAACVAPGAAAGELCPFHRAVWVEGLPAEVRESVLGARR